MHSHRTHEHKGNASVVARSVCAVEARAEEGNEGELELDEEGRRRGEVGIRTASAVRMTSSFGLDLARTDRGEVVNERRESARKREVEEGASMARRVRELRRKE